MNATLLALILVLPGDCDNFHSAPKAVRCPHYTPPVRWYCKPCAGCAGGTCLSCQEPFFGSAPYNYRVQFDYPWSQQPVYPLGCFPTGSADEAEEIILDSSSRKPRTTLKR